MSFDPNQPSAEIKSRVKESYDAIADTYNKWTEGHSDLRRQYLDKFIAQLPTASAAAGTQEVPQLRILELGCGAGEPATRILASLPGAQVTANDISSRQVALGRENALKWDLDASSSVRFVEGDMMDRNVVDFPAGSLDGVVGLYSIIHLPKDEQAEMLARLAGWLKEGGILLANFSAGESEGMVLEEWLNQKEGWMFWSGWGEGTVEKLQGAGLEVVVRGIEPEGVDVDFLWVLARKVKASV
ncbi:related to O-methyltransferase [Cephalotrichum gorgonifer]|uniref:Related to O-methyltransferase n=1 Tax=Cephalotrichum gorgonifer TaxID=2041049 RepID=A0AAE8N4M6_9PEZI|nr:related to O-methyltransferase [Cephalotrichum gorgonifer]